MDKKMRHIDFSFGTSLRNAREKRNYKREQIAERAEISPRFLAAIESGRRKPSLDVLIRLVNAIGASFDEILAPQVNVDSEIVDRIRRLVPQCNRRDQELLLALIDKMLDTKENNANKECGRVYCPAALLYPLLYGPTIFPFVRNSNPEVFQRIPY